MIVIIILSHNA